MMKRTTHQRPRRQGAGELSSLRSIRLVLAGVVSLMALAVTLGVATRAQAAPETPPASVSPALPTADLLTAHYDLHVEGLDAREVGDMLEQLYAQLRNYFGAAPRGRLRLALYATREKWASAIQADGERVPPKAGGYYAPYTQKVYAWIQPSVYSTRHLLLHEATHQFHWLAATGNAAPSANWYIEGLAEYFGMHNWDGKSLRTGLVPTITLEDYPAAAWKKYEAAGADLQTMCYRADRPEAWALVRFLLETHHDQFRRLAARLDRQDEPIAAWKEVFGNDAAGLSQEFGNWLRNHTQPWQIVWVAWQQRGDAIECESQTMSMTILKETPKTFTVQVEPQTVGGTAGLVFGYESQRDFYLFHAAPDNNVRILRRQNGSWVTVFLQTLSPAENCRVLSVTADEKSTTLWAGGKKITTIAAIGQVGLSAENGRALFRLH